MVHWNAVAIHCLLAFVTIDRKQALSISIDVNVCAVLIVNNIIILFFVCYKLREPEAWTVIFGLLSILALRPLLAPLWKRHKIHALTKCRIPLAC